jgi:transcriptional regulator with XRE-family HTH domain
MTPGARATTRCAENTPPFYFCLRKVEGCGHSCLVDNKRTENFAQLIARLKAEYQVNEVEIARRLGLHFSTVYNWSQGTRAAKNGPRPATLRKIHEAFPKFSIPELEAAAGRQAPGPLSPEAEERVQGLYRELTAEQQKMIEVQMRALAEQNRTGGQ